MRVVWVGAGMSGGIDWARTEAAFAGRGRMAAAAIDMGNKEP